MPPKKKTPAPIDRPLSRAYLRQFTGWSTAYPPGHSEPTSLRIMENVMVDRNGSLLVRPGLRYISYAQSPDTDPLTDAVEGIAIDRPLVGSQEPFYVTTGQDPVKALLFAVRETDDTVGFRALLFNGTTAVVRTLSHPEVGFTFPQGETALRFSAATTHVEYLQIDNKILALSDAGEEVRLFFVGSEKIAKRVNSITMPRWEDSDKLTVVHPDAAWINQQAITTRRNEVRNSSFEIGGTYWTKSARCGWSLDTTSPQAGTQRLKLYSLPLRTNLQTSPLHSVSTLGTAGWHPNTDYGNPTLTKDGSYMKVYESSGKHTFLAYGAKLSYGVVAGQKYRVALDFDLGTHVQPITVLTFYNAAGAKIGSSTSLVMPKKAGRYSSPAVAAPTGTTTMRISVGGRNEEKTSTFVKVKNIVLCKDGESTTMFSGSSTSDATHKYFWTGTANASASVDHPPVDVSITCDKVPIKASTAFAASIYVTSSLAKAFTLRARAYNKDNQELAGYDGPGNTTVGGGWIRAAAGTATSTANAILADMRLTVTALAHGETVFADAALIESGASTPGVYFDGSTAPTTLITNQWGDRNLPHKTFSVQTIKTNVDALPLPETPTALTLIKTGGATANPYKIGFFYTFENDLGESAPSKITEVRVQRPWSNWIWEKPNTNGEPGGTTLATDIAELCADQLVASMSSVVYAQAVAEGALKWNLYAFAWSDQEAVPVTAQLVAQRNLYVDSTAALRAAGLTYLEGGWQAVTPARRVGLNDTILPTRLNRVNYSDPPNSRTGLVAGDRIILLGDPNKLATIRWTSNRPGEYTNFTAARGGGEKTLTSGNLNIPASVVLWQNPQSVDTLCILCMSQDGSSVSYYMQPASINAQSGSTSIMGFEETTSTPGTVSPYGNEIMNNALFRPTDKALLKSTAQNYNISHKQLSDTIANMWVALHTKEWIMSAQLNNRLCFLVNNPFGEILEAGCKGNELWVYDVTSEQGFWSRFLIQGSALRVFSLSGREYLGVTHPDGLFYLDPDARLDDYVVSDPLDPDYLKVRTRPIPWRFETNTQGANRAHDAWAHLQQVQITVGNFTGTMEYGVRGQDVNYQLVDAKKLLTDPRQIPEGEVRWDIDDILQVRRDLREWFFYAHSVEGVASWGEIGYVQYRYTPVSVNVGYEHGSVETFEYGRNVATGADSYAENGIPLPVMDYTRP